MRIEWGIAVAALAALAGLAGRAAADTVDGTVTGTTSRWVDGDRLIVTDVVVRTPDGRDVTVVEPGGTVDGIGQTSFPTIPIPSVGDQVAVAAHPALDLSSRESQVVDDLQVTATAAPAHPALFVRTTTKGKVPLAWASGCVFLSVDSEGTPDLPGDQSFQALAAQVDAWNSAVSSCSYQKLMVAGKVTLPAHKPIGNDKTNMIVFRNDAWTRPATSTTPEMNLPSGASGLTTVTYVDDASSSHDGELLDADVEINGVEYAISWNGTSLGNPALCKADLQNTLAHELGHVLGLDHSCNVPGDPPKVDNNGNPVPMCADTSDPVITEATMYNFQECGETKKESPSPDDIAGVCAAYPRDQDPGNCLPVSQLPSAGCCDSGGSPSAPGALALTSLLLLARGRRRPRSA